MATIPITILTPNAVQQSLTNNGLSALGLTTVSLNSRWGLVTPNFDGNALTLNFSGQVMAPFLGIRENVFKDVSSTLGVDVTADATTLALESGTGANFPSPVTPAPGPGDPTPPAGRIVLVLSNASGSKQELVECTQRSGDTLTVIRGAYNTAKQSFSTGDTVALRLTPAQRVSEFYEVDGSPVDANAAVLRLHPQAAARLHTICTTRYSGGNALTLPLPVAMLVRGVEGFRAARWYRPDEVIDGAGTGVVSFHDHRGHIVDPLYVANLFNDMINGLPGLLPAGVGGTAAGTGGVQTIANIVVGPTTVVHFIDPHGNSPRIATPGATLITDDGSGTQTGAVSGNLLTLAAGNRISVADAATTPLRFGFATNGTMGTAPLAPPAISGGGALQRRFYRVMVVDLPWYLLGNRTSAAVLGVGPDDQRIPADLLPVVRDQVAISYHADGMDTLGDANRVLNLAQQNMILAVSPVIDQTLITPAAPGANAHWPAFPAPNPGGGFPNPPVQLSPANVTAQFAAGNDVVVTIAGGAAPPGATIRIYPQRFIEIASINSDEPSFVRADGGSNIVNGANPTSIFLRNPFNLGSAQPLPNPAVLTMDIVVTPRAGNRRLTGAISVNVAAGAAAAPIDPFFGPPASNIMGVMLPQMQGVAESPLFGIP
jgi:hypothetical protein